MNHLLICPEFPPAPSGGIGTYARHIAELLARRGETVHVIGPLAREAPERLERLEEGRLVVHRIPYLSWRSLRPRRPHPAIESPRARRLFGTGYPPQAFAWQAARLAERLVDEAAIDVIESQEYEAPLYFFQLRRALGLAGGERRPPVIVHLHSPTESILEQDDWPTGHPYLMTAPRLEEYSVRAADALLSPSRFLAGGVAERLGLDLGEIEIIPYPIGDTPFVERPDATWRGGGICYVGRLEGRKGVLEWIDAAVAVALERDDCRFDFIGANVLGDGSLPGAAIVERRIPDRVRDRFHFHGRKPRHELAGYLAEARIGVVPSRWDNFPNTCVEAMSSGLPVLATRHGGMAELLEDGVSGWLADADAGSLLEALRRALDTPPGGLAEMGVAARRRVLEACDNDRTLDRQLELRRRLVASGARRSLRVPVAGAAHKDRGRPETRATTASDAPDEGVAIVVARRGSGSSSVGLESLSRQSRSPLAIVLVDTAGGAPQPPDPEGATPLLRAATNGGLAAGWAEGLRALREAGIRPAGVVFAGDGDALDPELVGSCATVLERQPRVGIVSPWTEQPGAAERHRMRPGPTLPHQWVRNDVSPASAFRLAAIEQVDGIRVSLDDAFALWDLSIGILDAGWGGVSLPRFLCRTTCPEETSFPSSSSLRMRRRLLERAPSSFDRLAGELALLLRADARIQLAEGSISQKERLTLLWLLARRPGRLLGWMARIARARLGGGGR